MSKRTDRDLPLAALALVVLLLWGAYNVVENPAWGAWIVKNCGWVCQ